MNSEGSILGERRTLLHILAQILMFCREPRSKIRVMQHTGTSFKLTGAYLLKLQKAGFIEERKDSKTYATTEKGQSFLERWEQLIELLRSEEDQK